MFNISAVPHLIRNQEKVTAGDVIAIDKATGKITKFGRSYNRASDFSVRYFNFFFPHSILNSQLFTEDPT